MYFSHVYCNLHFYVLAAQRNCQKVGKSIPKWDWSDPGFVHLPRSGNSSGVVCLLPRVAAASCTKAGCLCLVCDEMLFLGNYCNTWKWSVAGGKLQLGNAGSSYQNRTLCLLHGAQGVLSDWPDPIFCRVHWKPSCLQAVFSQLHRWITVAGCFPRNPSQGEIIFL